MTAEEQRHAVMAAAEHRGYSVEGDRGRSVHDRLLDDINGGDVAAVVYVDDDGEVHVTEFPGA